MKKKSWLDYLFYDIGKQQYDFFVSGLRKVEDKIIPTLEMSLDSIKRIVTAHYKKKPDNKEIFDIADVLLNALPKLKYKDKNYSRNELSDLTKFNLNEINPGWM